MDRNLITFNTEHRGPIPDTGLIDLERVQSCRKKLQTAGLFGTIAAGELEGYDYGNLSYRVPRGIIISASQTSSRNRVEYEDIALVTGYDPDSYTVNWYGINPPSSETSLHWSVYEATANSRAVVHGHLTGEFPGRWTRYFEEHNLPITRSRSQSKEIGLEIKETVQKRGTDDIIGMDNHYGGFGLIAIDNSLEETCDKLIQFKKMVF